MTEPVEVINLIPTNPKPQHRNIIGYIWDMEENPKKFEVEVNPIKKEVYVKISGIFLKSNAKLRTLLGAYSCKYYIERPDNTTKAYNLPDWMLEQEPTVPPVIQSSVPSTTKEPEEESPSDGLSDIDKAIAELEADIGKPEETGRMPLDMESLVDAPDEVNFNLTDKIQQEVVEDAKAIREFNKARSSEVAKERHFGKELTAARLVKELEKEFNESVSKEPKAKRPKPKYKNTPKAGKQQRQKNKGTTEKPQGSVGIPKKEL